MSDANHKNTCGCLVRLFWMLAGNILLVVSANGVMEHKGGFFSLADLAFWAVALSLAAARYVDIKHLGGRTATGESATMAHWWRYAGLLLVISLALWGLAHALRSGG